MPLSMVVRLRTGRYDAASMNPRSIEWPPSPARLFCALTASTAGDPSGVRALRALEALGAPEIWASPNEDVSEHRRSGYVVTGRLHPDRAGGENQPGRVKGIRTRLSALPASAEFAFVWPEADVDADTRQVLSSLAWRTPYLGRATSDVELTVASDAPEQRAEWVVWRPVPLSLEAGDAVSVDVPYPGYLDNLDAEFQAGEPAWRARRLSVSYSHELPQAEPPQPAVVYDDLVVLRFDTGATGRVPLSGRQSMVAAEALRAAVMRKLDDRSEGIPAQVSGHGADGLPHVAFLALPNVGWDHSDGRLLGVAVAIPRGLNRRDRTALLRAVLRIERLGAPNGQWQFDVEFRADRREPFGLAPRRWSGRADGETSWATVTPMMLDRFPQGKRTVIDRVAESFAIAGYPVPQEIEILTGPPLAGAVNGPVLTSSAVRRQTRPSVHCRVTFGEPVVGPVLVGALRYLGIGLFAPVAAHGSDNDTV